jgi:type VI secretion system secreted protein Hcp
METCKRNLFLLLAVTTFLFGTRAYSAQSCVLVLAGVQGESTVIPGGIDVLSFSSGLTHADGRGFGGFGGGAARARFQDFQITKKIDKSSPVLFEGAASGEHYADAALYCSKTGGAAGASGQVYLTFEFKLVAIKTIDWSGPGDQGPTEQVTFEYGSVRITYRPQNPDGALGEPVSRCWDILRNHSC